MMYSSIPNRPVLDLYISTRYMIITFWSDFENQFFKAFLNNFLTKLSQN